MDADINELLERRKKLKASLIVAEETRNQMEGKMQSRYDTQKEEWALQCDIYENQIEQIDKLLAKLQKLKDTPTEPTQDTVILGSQVELRIDDDDPVTYILLDESGGYKLKGISTLSTKSPIGKAILGIKACLLYTSDAADERSSVDLGGRRIIKKKNKLD